MLFSLAELNEHELDIIQNLEKKLGTRILALRPMKIEFDSLSEDEVAEINQLEVELGLAIVAVK